AGAAQAAVTNPEADSRPQPVDPDYRLINLPTSTRLPRHKGNFQLTHRFAGNLANGDFVHQLSNLFGLDEGALVGLEYRYAIFRHTEAAVYRSTLDRTFQFHGKYDALRQEASMPISFSALASVEGADN